MYTPNHFLPRNNQTLEFVKQNSFGELLSQLDGKIVGSHLPILIDQEKNALHCHVAKANPQWQQIDGQEVLVIFTGPHGYISPSWYEKAGVPTWNYQAVHVYGKARSFQDEKRLASTVKHLSEIYESEFEKPWQPDFDERMLKAIVGIEIEITDIQAKYKLSQNRSKVEQENVMEQLQLLGNTDLAKAMLREMKIEN